jgi:hypothetical protein
MASPLTDVSNTALLSIIVTDPNDLLVHMKALLQARKVINNVLPGSIWNVLELLICFCIQIFV